MQEEASSVESNFKQKSRRGTLKLMLFIHRQAQTIEAKHNMDELKSCLLGNVYLPIVFSD